MKNFINLSLRGAPSRARQSNLAGVIASFLRSLAMTSHTRAETLIEVLIALSVIMAVSSITTGVHVTSTRSTANNRNDLIAATLAEEGIELMRNIRDTNFLRFSDDTQCWNMKPGETNCTLAASKLAAGSSTVWIDPADFSVKFANYNYGINTADLNAPGNNDSFKLKLRKLVDPNDPTSGAKLYVNNGIAGDDDSFFYRGLDISYINDSMEVVSTVYYPSATGKVRTVVRATVLTNTRTQ